MEQMLFFWKSQFEKELHQTKKDTLHFESELNDCSGVNMP